MTKREIVASEDHDCDRICWVENQSGDYIEATETQYRRLEAIYQAKYEVRDGWDRYAMKEIDVFVTGCFTEQGCKDYINKMVTTSINRSFTPLEAIATMNIRQCGNSSCRCLKPQPLTQHLQLSGAGVENLLRSRTVGADYRKLSHGCYGETSSAENALMARDFAAELREAK